MKISIFVVVFGLFHVEALPRRKNCDCVCGQRGRENRIVGGKQSAPNEFPWLVGLVKQQKLYCGAAIISENYLLTAAHCIETFTAGEILAYAGAHNISTDYTQRIRARKLIPHEYFNLFTFDNDIGLIELETPLAFGPKVQPICLPPEDHDYAGSIGVIAGWGRTGEKSSPSTVLHSTKVPVWTRKECLESGYGRKRITENMFCGGFSDGKIDACQGDSGGPIQFEKQNGGFEVMGVVSWGRGCARPNLPGIYTKVQNYLRWIKKKTAKSCLCKPKTIVEYN